MANEWQIWMTCE